MKIEPISQISAEECRPRRNLFIRLSNMMSTPEAENPIEKAFAINKSKLGKMGIENLEEFTIYPKEVVDGKTIITA